jgi:hypothetical protein
MAPSESKRNIGIFNGEKRPPSLQRQGTPNGIPAAVIV